MQQVGSGRMGISPVTSLDVRSYAWPMLRQAASNFGHGSFRNLAALNQESEGGRPGQQISGLWKDWTKVEVKAATALWVNRMVIGLELCPFALESMPGLRIVVSEAMNREDLLDELALEMGYLVEKPLDRPATTLVVFPPELFDNMRAGEVVPGSSDEAEIAGETMNGEEDNARSENPGIANFETFMEIATKGTETAQDLFGEALLLLMFHPNATFSSVPFDPCEFALRSPFPTIHLLRGSDVREAESICESQNRTTEDVAIANEAVLRGIGYAELRSMLEDVFRRAKGY